MPVGDAQRLVGIGREHVGAEAERGVVRELDGLVLGADAVDRRDRAEELLAVGVVVRRDAGQDARREEVARRALPPTSVAPPCDRPLSWSSRRSAAVCDESGPIAASGDAGRAGSTAVSAAVSLSTNGS